MVPSAPWPGSLMPTGSPLLEPPSQSQTVASTGSRNLGCSGGGVIYIGGGSVPKLGICVMARRKHENSHFGCATCKKRKVKCDETYPQCLCCVRYKQECPFSQLTPEEIADRLEQKRLNQIKKNKRKNRRPRKSRATEPAPTPEASYWSSPMLSSSMASSSSSSVSTWHNCSPLLSSEADTISPVPESSPMTAAAPAPMSAPMPTVPTMPAAETADTTPVMMPTQYSPQYPVPSYHHAQLYAAAEWASAPTSDTLDTSVTIPDPESPPPPPVSEQPPALWPSALESWLFDDLDMPAYPSSPPVTTTTNTPVSMGTHAQALADFGISVTAPVATPSW